MNDRKTCWEVIELRPANAAKWEASLMKSLKLLFYLIHVTARAVRLFHTIIIIYYIASSHISW